MRRFHSMYRRVVATHADALAQTHHDPLSSVGTARAMSASVARRDFRDARRLRGDLDMLGPGAEYAVLGEMSADSVCPGARIVGVRREVEGGNFTCYDR